MSNRGKLTPPASIVAVSKHYRCSDCAGRAGKPRWSVELGWQITVMHQPTCPSYRAGHTDRDAMVSAALMATALHAGTDTIELSVTDDRTNPAGRHTRCLSLPYPRHPSTGSLPLSALT